MLAALGGRARRLAAQTPAPEVGLGFGVDTAHADVGPIVRLVRAYLARPDSTARARGLWRADDALARRIGDLAGGFAYQGFPATIAGVLATGTGDSVYVVKLLHARAARAGGPASPIALERLYAVRAAGSAYGWQLEAALPRLTRGWGTATAGPITFHYAPGQLPNAARAAAAARFVDSVAALFGVPAPARLDYYVAASPDEYFRAIGLDFWVLGSSRRDATGGNTGVDQGVLFAGDPNQGELYRHELVHATLGRRVWSGFVGEGVAVWLGGSRGLDAPALYRVLVAYERAHPAVSFGALVRGDVADTIDAVSTSDATYASGALLVDAVYRRSGAAGLRRLIAAPAVPEALLVAVARALGVDGVGALDAWWRGAAAAAAARGRTAGPTA